MGGGSRRRQGGYSSSLRTLDLLRSPQHQIQPGEVGGEPYAGVCFMAVLMCWGLTSCLPPRMSHSILFLLPHPIDIPYLGLIRTDIEAVTGHMSSPIATPPA